MKNKIRKIRQMKGMMQKDLAAAAGVSRPYIHDLEIGARGAKKETMEKIAVALGVTVEELKEKGA